jgi:uncharacterized protein (TIGR00730 family)
VFAPFREVPKVTIFGSARTLPDDPAYVQTRDLASALARAGWMVVTGAGPGIMAAGTEGAGRERSIGVNIRLPFEQEANPFIAADPKLVSMKYFFTRKLMLMKESAGFAVLPGGFGTLDETFELLTLLQTGKAAPAPLVLLEVPGGTYWKAWDRFIQEELAARGLVDASDLLLCRITDDVDDAVNEILGFFRNYHSIRYVGPRLVVRLKSPPTAEEVAALNREFADICVDGEIEAQGPLPAEIADDDHVELPRLAFQFDRMSHGRLRSLIDALNRLPSAPPLAAPDASAASSAGSPPDTGGARTTAAPDPVVNQLLARVRQGGEAALEAAAGLHQVLEDGGLGEAEQHAVASELSDLIVGASTSRLRLALLSALAACSPFVAFDVALELLVEHRARFAPEETGALLAVLDEMLETAESDAALAHLALLLRLVDPRPVLDQLAASRDSAVAAGALGVRERMDRVGRLLDH